MSHVDDDELETRRAASDGARDERSGSRSRGGAADRARKATSTRTRRRGTPTSGSDRRDGSSAKARRRETLVPGSKASRADLEDVLLESAGSQAAEFLHMLDERLDLIHARLDRLSSGPVTLGKTESPRQQGVARVDRREPGIQERLVPSEPAPQGSLSVAPIAEFSTESDWSGWSYLPGGEESNGHGVASDRITLLGGGLLRLTVVIERTDRTPCRARLRVTNEENEQLGPTTPLTEGESSTFLFVSLQTKRIKLHVMASEPHSALGFSIRLARLERVDIDSFYERNRPMALAPAVASMASIPSRRVMLHDAVQSLLAQCDVVRVFLNDYPDVPGFLDHPRVEVRRSQEWDDKGDAGKFAWIDADDEPGYRVIADDDLIFPPDFVATLSRKSASYGDRAIVAMHGVLLKQPVKTYYDPSSRNVFHFQWELEQDRTVHVMGTNAMLFHSGAVRMRWHEFMYRNMADIFLARYAQTNKLPMIVVERPSYWVIQNSQDGGFETIYDHSLNSTGSNFDTSQLQDALIKRIAPLTMQPTSRPKVVLGLIATTQTDFDAALSTWEMSRSPDFDWVLIVTAGVDAEELRRHVAEVRSSHELHVVDDEGSSAAQRIGQMVSLAHDIGFRAMCVALDVVRFGGGGWTGPCLADVSGEGEDALLVFPGTSEHGAVTRRDIPDDGPMPGLVMFGESTVRRIGGIDESLPDGPTAFMDLASRIASANADAPRVSISAGSAVASDLTVPTSAQAPRASGGSLPSRRVYVPTARASRSRGELDLSINDVFDRVLFINLDRRPDRLETMAARLEAAGIKAERVPAVDGESPDVVSEYQEYVRTATWPQPTSAREIRGIKQFFQDYDSDAARVAFVEAKEGRKAIESAGAWGYLKTWESILRETLKAGTQRTLVLDDDVRFHREARALTNAALAELPDDWLVLQLGTLQYEWSEDWITWCGRNLYRTNGSSIGSHAVGFDFEVVPFLLEQVSRLQLPFDIGPLSAATRAFKERCFVNFPNAVIQDLTDPSDINTSRFQGGNGIEKAARRYRWDLTDYQD